MKKYHILSLSGGKDSTALAFFMKENMPEIFEKTELVFYDTGCDLPETYDYLNKIEIFLNKKITRLTPEKSFEHLLTVNRVLPSHFRRWCTVELKVRPSQKYIEEKLKKEGKKIENADGKLRSMPEFLARDVFNNINSVAQKNTSQDLNNLIKHVKDITPENVKEFLKSFKLYCSNEEEDFFSYMNKMPNIPSDKKEILISHVKKCLEKSMGYNDTYMNLNSQVKNEYYTGVSCQVSRKGDYISVVHPDRPWETYSIDLAKLVENLPVEEGIRVKKMIQELPGEVLIDLAIELKNSSLNDGQSDENQRLESISKKKRGYSAAAWYSSNSDSITVGVDGDYDSSRTFVRELGHAVDFNGRILNTASSESSKVFQNTFKKEMEVYLSKGNKIYDGNENVYYKKGSSYATYNEYEMFAECYTLMMTGNCNSKQLILDYFPNTLKAVGTLLKEVRAMDEAKRRSK